MANVKPTRMELLKTKKRIKLAKRGHKLLKHKQDVLVMEFFSLLKEIKRIRIGMGDRLGKAQDALYNSIALQGRLEIERISLGLAREAEISFESDRIMGVKVPRLKNINMEYEWPGYDGHSVEMENAMVRYRKLLPEVIKLAEKQLILKKLGDEIKKTKRKVNSLDYITIPRFEKTAKNITFHLEEVERENFSRLKVMKRIKENSE